MERRRLSHSDDGALPYHAKRRKTGFRQMEDESIRERYTVAWICALHIEMAAARAMLDEEHSEYPQQGNDTNSYVLGSIRNHNVVIACLPDAQYGLNNAASVLSNMRRTFPNIEIGLMVGIGGGVPLKADIRLGDIVVGVRVMQYDMGKTLNGGFQRTGVPKIPDSTIRTVISNLRSRHELTGSRVPLILREKMGSYAAYSLPSEPDRLFAASYHHSDPDLPCDKCDSSKIETRKIRSSTDPAIYYGGIGSANTVMKDSTIRDEIARELDVLCFEMEAAGLMDIMPCLPIRGICDYSDSHKSKEWQRYAAATAAAYAFEFLEVWRGASQESYVGQTQVQNESSAVSERHQDILNSLDFEQIDARKLIIKAAHSKTCRWFLKHPDYLSWIDQQQTFEHHGFLWIRGKPGAGKSTIMKFIYQQSKKKDRKHQTLTASFFFNARGEILEKTVSGMYRSLLLQLFHGFPDLECVLDDPELLPRNQSGCPPLNALKDLLRAAIAKLGQRSFRCFIDALDECDEQQVMDLVEYFEDLAEQCTEDNVDLRICFSSRHYPYIDIKFGIRIILEEQVGHASDLESYIKSNLRIKDKRLLAELQEKMLEKAAGVFLWVVLVVDIMNKENCRGRLALRRRLEQVPSGLSDLFKDLLKRDNSNMEELQLSLLWILLSERPLKPEEYYHAIWSGLRLGGLADLEIPEVGMEDSEDCFARCVISSSKGLAEITKAKQPRVQFIHESVRDFLIKDKGLHELWPELGPDWESVGHDRLKMCCYSYFEFFVEKELPEVEDHATAKHRVAAGTQAYPFLQYANASGSSRTPLSWACENGHFGIARVLAERDNQPIDVDRSAPSPLMLASKNGHIDIARWLLNRNADIYREYRKESAICFAASNGHAEIVEFLLDEGQHINTWGVNASPIISLAAENGHEEVVKLLLARKARVEAKNNRKMTPLHCAAKKEGFKATMQELLRCGADINARDGTSRTPLMLATQCASIDEIGFLISQGADVTAQDREGETCLHKAMGRSKETFEIVQLLLENGARADARDKSGETCLHAFARWGAVIHPSDDLIQLVASRGAHINAKDDDGNTPLHIMTQNGAVEALSRFADFPGLDLNARNHLGKTPLHFAASLLTAGPGVLSVLIEKGADINSLDNESRTPFDDAMQREYEPVIQFLFNKGGKPGAT
ncbi:ankyrin 3 [Fusarium napiforme]|uniref:Ankyrin 3 n=1 Tax=Fusarium napiforme TaxID=42672 RepID=A0A8H5MZM3_9HYPO|nr:ankyrin 3 [Fusarium napiforme]